MRWTLNVGLVACAKRKPMIWMIRIEFHSRRLSWTRQFIDQALENLWMKLDIVSWGLYRSFVTWRFNLFMHMFKLIFSGILVELKVFLMFCLITNNKWRNFQTTLTLFQAFCFFAHWSHFFFSPAKHHAYYFMANNNASANDSRSTRVMGKKRSWD